MKQGQTELKVYFQSSISNIPADLLWGLVVVFILGLVLLVWWNGRREGIRVSAVMLLAEWIFLILSTAVLFREPQSERQCHVIPFWSYFNYPEDSYFIEVAMVNMLNVILFIPMEIGRAHV